MLEHGGRLREAARRYDIPLADWLDLSTGIAPWPFPLPAIPEQAWTRLPESDDGLEAAAGRRRHACPPVAGSYPHLTPPTMWHRSISLTY
ncbi:hypothetical protein ACLI4B_35200, partial [Pseudomonas aeruginosa]